ncbi:MAG: porin [Alphaproteobacteria bacterium]
MFLNPAFLRYGKPLVAAAPIMLALTGLPTTAHACTGDAATDPNLCVNDGRTVNGFGEFFNSDLTGVPGATTAPGSTEDESENPFLDALFNGLGGRKPGAENEDISISGTIDTSGDPGGPFGGEEDFYWWEDTDVDFGFSGMSDNGLTFSGFTDNGLRFGARIRIIDEPEPRGGGISIGGRINEGYFDSFLNDGANGGTDASDIDNAPEIRFNLTRSIVADNGLKFGVQIQLEETGGGIDEFDPFISGTFGEIRIGDESSDRAFSYGAPDDVASGGVFRPQITLDNGITIGIDLQSGSGTAGANTEAGPKFTNFSPSFGGFRLDVGDLGSNDTAGGVKQFDIGNQYVDSFGDLKPALSARWGVDSAASNFAVGQASAEGYGNLGVGIKSFDYVPLDDYGIRVQYGLDGSAVVVTAPSGTRLGGNAPAPAAAPVTPPPAPVTGTQVGTMSFANQGQRSEVNLIRTADGKTHAVDTETGHDFGTVHESRSGFGWSFDNPPVPAPTPPDPAAADPISAQDRQALFTDGFESGNTSAWLTPNIGF